jgi:hypothetical protein
LDYRQVGYNAEMEDAPRKPRRRLFQFGLGTMLWIAGTVLLGLCIPWPSIFEPIAVLVTLPIGIHKAIHARN